MEKPFIKVLNIDKDMDKINNLCNNILKGKIKSKFNLVRSSTKTASWCNSADIKPDAYTYDPILVDLIFNNNLHTQINDLFKNKMYLFDIQFRIVTPIKNKSLIGYTEWHRDSYFKIKNNETKIKGILPCSYKLIIYPKLNKLEYECFKIIPESFVEYENNGYELNDYKNSKNFNDIINVNWKQDFSKKYNSEKIISFKNSNKKALFFDSSVIHTATNTPIPQFRIIYWFSSMEDLEYNKTNISITRANPDILKNYKIRLNQE